MRRRRWIGAVDRALMARVARTDSVVLDRVLPALSRAANYSRLWYGVAAVLAATRRPRARRGALRGLVALSLASFTVNVLSKRLAGRARPDIELAPLIRRLAIAPRTTSFPSGHSASAAAFATGVLLESPLYGAPIAVAAAGVATSRVAVGVHYPSDVAAGVGIGVAAGLVTQTWWPRTPLAPATAGPPDLPVPASIDGEGLILVTNAAAGSVRDTALRLITEELPAAEVVVAEGDDLPHVMDQAAKRCRVLGVAGGDGTVNLAARAAVREQVPLVVVPAGTFNHFARDIGVETARDAINALRAGDAVRVDLGRAGDESFVNTASIGLYVDLVRFRERWEDRLGKWPAMLLGLVTVLSVAQPQDVTVDGVPRRLWMLFAGNGHYLPVGFAPATRPSLDDGMLDVRIVDATVRFARTRLVLGALTRTLRWCRPYEASLRSSLELACADGPLGLSVDGEVLQVSSAVVLGKSSRALTVYRPAHGVG